MPREREANVAETLSHAVAPVRLLPGEQPFQDEDSLDPGTALCLSGGGYRAMLFHLGAVWRLNDAGMLPTLKQVSSVSGGSVTAGVLAMNWKYLDFDEAGVARGFRKQVVEPLLNYASRTVDLPVVLKGLFGFRSISAELMRAYSRFLYGDTRLSDLPETPKFVFNATNIQSESLFRFSREMIADWRVGVIPNPTLPLAAAVAASSACPPFLSPLRLSFPAGAFTPGSGAGLDRAPFTRQVELTDGGVYDNLGLETAWKNYFSILVSDAGGEPGTQARSPRDWPRHLFRVISLIDNQLGSVRKRQLIASYDSPISDAHRRNGTYWGIRSDVGSYDLPPSAGYPFSESVCAPAATAKLAAVPTRMKKLPRALQEQLVNWGYAISDTALRKHVDPGMAVPPGFPFPERRI